MTTQKLDKATLIRDVRIVSTKLGRYSLLAFIVLIALLYGFIVMRLSAATSTEPSPDVISSQVKSSKTPYIDESIVKQLKSLQDNSVSVQTIFNDARNNPFTGEGL